MIYLIVGNTGAGKTTHALRLKEEKKAIIFSIDKWNKELFIPDRNAESDLYWFLERIERSETIMMDLILQLESNGVSSILDLGFSKKGYRDKFLNFAKDNNIQSEIHYIDRSPEERWANIIKRNTEKGPTYEIEVTKENFDFMEEWFEAPEGIEYDSAVII